jgi:hypothetical protein
MVLGFITGFVSLSRHYERKGLCMDLVRDSEEHRWRSSRPVRRRKNTEKRSAQKQMW